MSTGIIYKCKYINDDLSLQQRVREYCEYYNSEIDFEDYYFKINGIKLGYDGKDKCKLHDEINGESFSYSRSAKIWSCWGSCKATALGIVEYHQMYLKKSAPLVTIIDALKSLYNIYPYLPKFYYSFNKNMNKTLKDEHLAVLKVIKERAKSFQNLKYNNSESAKKDLSIADNYMNDLSNLCFYCFTYIYLNCY